MSKYLVLNVVGQVIEAGSPDAAVVKGKANISAPTGGQVALTAISLGQCRDAGVAAQPAPVSMAAGLAGGGNMTPILLLSITLT